jgi:hypothetical protein
MPLFYYKYISLSLPIYIYAFNLKKIDFLIRKGISAYNESCIRMYIYIFLNFKINNFKPFFFVFFIHLLIRALVFFFNIFLKFNIRVIISFIILNKRKF